MKKTLVAAAIAVLAMTSACNSNGGGNANGASLSGNDAKAATAISDSIMKEQKSGSTSAMQLKQKDATCIGNGLVNKIGTAQLQKYGIITKDLKLNKDVTTVKMSKNDAESAADTFFGCADVMGMMKKAMESSGQMPPQVKGCMDKALTKDAVHGMFVGMFSGDQNASKPLTGAMMKCAAQGMPSAPSN
ncbi:MAG: hypothetical protein ACXVW6_03810 [Nocardioidaceae bacterium]